MTTNTTTIRDLPLAPITREGFAPFGTLVEPSEDGAPFGPEDAMLDLTGGTPRFYIMRLDYRDLTIKHITRHRGVTQLLASVGGKTWQLAVAPPLDVEKPEAEPNPGDIRAFDIPGNVAVMLHRGTWHAGPYFEEPEVSFFNLELADTNVGDHQTCKLADRFGVAFRLTRA